MFGWLKKILRVRPPTPEELKRREKEQKRKARQEEKFRRWNDREAYRMGVADSPPDDILVKRFQKYLQKHPKLRRVAEQRDPDFMRAVVGDRSAARGPYSELYFALYGVAVASHYHGGSGGRGFVGGYRDNDDLFDPITSSDDMTFGATSCSDYDDSGRYIDCIHGGYDPTGTYGAGNIGSFDNGFIDSIHGGIDPTGMGGMAGDHNPCSSSNLFND